MLLFSVLFVDGYKKREAGRWVSVSLSVGVVAVGSGCLLVGVQLPEWRKVLQCWVYEVNGHAEHVGGEGLDSCALAVLPTGDEEDTLAVGHSPQIVEQGLFITDESVEPRPSGYRPYSLPSLQIVPRL